MPHRQKILVVDDEYDNAFILKSGLERKGGYNGDVFTDPLTAWNDFQADSYDLIVIDVRMPDMNVIEKPIGLGELANKVKRFLE